MPNYASQIKFYQIFNRYFYKLTPIGTRRLGIRSSFYSNFLFDYLDDVLVEEPVPFPVELHPDVLHLGGGGGKVETTGFFLHFYFYVILILIV